ncbi:Crp/Fnr family transcriptional regulator [Sphingomonas bacterium]|uniref:Crp/Fnr family transcriptional regulator n=1 Tax=Sphingomonas bacterium TaxID=1895847 RepID=UPI0020C6B6CE|nr:Crp/Fnr family transcriptional regulator [Sphingomonas bacterium]
MRSVLSDADRSAILDLPMTKRSMSRSAYMLREGEPPATCSVLIEGYAFRQKLTSDGARQIVSLHLPGDALDLQGLFLDLADHNIQALTQAELAVIPRTAIRELMVKHPAVSVAIHTDITVEASICREWLTNVGRRQAQARLAHLLCEFAVRLDAQGLGTDGSYELPMIQEQIGDALGLTSVHINRTLKAMELGSLICRTGRSITFPNIDALRAVAGFSPLYLHLGVQGT